VLHCDYFCVIITDYFCIIIIIIAFDFDHFYGVLPLRLGPKIEILGIVEAEILTWPVLKY